jgi:hypothetical protein
MLAISPPRLSPPTHPFGGASILAYGEGRKPERRADLLPVFGPKREQKIKISTSEAAICMKTKTTWTKRPEKSGHLLPWDQLRQVGRKHAENEGSSGYMYENTDRSKNIICKMVILIAWRKEGFTTESTEHHREEFGSLFLRALRGLCGEVFAQIAALPRATKNMRKMKVHPAICMKTRTGQKTSFAKW